MARFSATMNAIEKGLDQTKPTAGAKLADDWLQQLEGFDKRGSKGLIGDLQKLKAELERPEPRDANVRKLLAKLGAATTKFADGAEGANQEKLRELGGKLSEAGGGHAAGGDEDA